MGLIQSIFCSITFCVERVLTWACCAFVLMLLMFMIVLLMVYGISVGYHYAQKELSASALTSRKPQESQGYQVLRSGPEISDQSPVVRLVAVNKTEVEHAPEPLLEIYRTRSPGENVYMETSHTAVIMLETERPPKEPTLLPHEQELARRLIGRIRRSRNNTVPFLRLLRSSAYSTALSEGNDTTISSFLRPLRNASGSLDFHLIQ